MEDEGGCVRNLYEFVRNSGRENGEFECEKNWEGSIRNYWRVILGYFGIGRYVF